MSLRTAGETMEAVSTMPSALSRELINQTKTLFSQSRGTRLNIAFTRVEALYDITSQSLNFPERTEN